MKNFISNWYLLIFVILIGIGSCTNNQRARNYGGTETINLPKGEKLIIATWRGDKGASNLWYLSEPMDSSYVPQTKKFHEISDYGVWEGTVVFIESK